MRVLVLGASGFLGSHIVRALLAGKHEVEGFRRETSSLELLRGLELSWWTGDVSDADSLRRAITGKEAVFGAAGIFAPSSDRERLHATNVLGARNVAQACLEAGARLVWTGSADVYAGTPRLEPADERGAATGERFDSPHAVSWTLAEGEVLRAVARGLDAVLLHPTLLVGAGERRLPASWLLSRFPVEVGLCPPGGVNLLPVEDCARAHLIALERAKKGAIYLLGGENFTNRALLDLVLELEGRSAAVLGLPRGGFEAASRVARVLGLRNGSGEEAERAALLYRFVSSRKAEQELGWKAGPARAALQAQIGWLRERGLAPAT